MRTDLPENYRGHFEAIGVPPQPFEWAVLFCPYRGPSYVVALFALRENAELFIITANEKLRLVP